jgi:hypothetical protein
MMRNSPVCLLPLMMVALLAWPGCKDKPKARNQDPGQNPGPATLSDAPGTEPVVDSRTQFDLAAAITAAERSDEAEDALDRVRRDFQGKRYRWTVYVMPALCPSAERCHVLPFDRAGADRTIMQGWMPRLELDADSFVALRRQCGDQPRCTIELEGTLSRLVLSTESLTSVHFGDVRIVTAPSPADVRQGD